jgi:hypothetical protein
MIDQTLPTENSVRPQGGASNNMGVDTDRHMHVSTRGVVQEVADGRMLEVPPEFHSL